MGGGDEAGPHTSAIPSEGLGVGDSPDSNRRRLQQRGEETLLAGRKSWWWGGGSLGGSQQQPLSPKAAPLVERDGGERRLVLEPKSHHHDCPIGRFLGFASVMEMRQSGLPVDLPVSELLERADPSQSHHTPGEYG